MDTKLSIAFLSGLSLFMSVGAFAVSDDLTSDELNWSYVMGDTKPMTTADKEVSNDSPEQSSAKENSGITCTAGCPARPLETQEPFILTYEDEALPVAERTNTFTSEDYFSSGSTLSVQGPIMDQTSGNPQIKTQYPVTRQYPISVQYPITVQRNTTVEQPVLVQQPIIVRRPVVMQQDITVQRQPTVIQGQPTVVQLQPSFVQGQPVYVQAPTAATFNPMMVGGLNTIAAPAMPMTLPQQIFARLPYQTFVPQYSQIPAQPMYQAMPPMYLSVPMTQLAPIVFQPTSVQRQQPVYQN